VARARFNQEIDFHSRLKAEGFVVKQQVILEDEPAFLDSVQSHDIFAVESRH